MDYDILDIKNDLFIKQLIYSYLPKDQTQINRDVDNNKVIYTIKTDIDIEYYYQLYLMIDNKREEYFNKVMFISRINRYTNEVIDYRYLESNFLYIHDEWAFIENLNELLTKYLKNTYINSFSSQWFNIYDKIKKYCDNLLKSDIVSIMPYCYDYYRFFIDIHYRELACVYSSHIEVTAYNEKINISSYYSYYFFLGISSSKQYNDVVYIDNLYKELIYIIPKITNHMIEDRKKYSSYFGKKIQEDNMRSMNMDDYIKSIINN